MVFRLLGWFEGRGRVRERESREEERTERSSLRVASSATNGRPPPSLTPDDDPPAAKQKQQKLNARLAHALLDERHVGRARLLVDCRERLLNGGDARVTTLVVVRDDPLETSDARRPRLVERVVTPPLSFGLGSEGRGDQQHEAGRRRRCAEQQQGARAPEGHWVPTVGGSLSDARARRKVCRKQDRRFEKIKPSTSSW